MKEGWPGFIYSIRMSLIILCLNLRLSPLRKAPYLPLDISLVSFQLFILNAILIFYLFRSAWSFPLYLFLLSVERNPSIVH